MKWFTRWRDKREVKRLWKEFDRFLIRARPGWGSPDRTTAFYIFCRLEAMGEDRVRDMLARATLNDLMVTH